jgi:hypothetical protein
LQTIPDGRLVVYQLRHWLAIKPGNFDRLLVAAS